MLPATRGGLRICLCDKQPPIHTQDAKDGVLGKAALACEADDDNEDPEEEEEGEECEEAEEGRKLLIMKFRRRPHPPLPRHPPALQHILLVILGQF